MREGKMGIKERSSERQKHIVAHRAKNFEDAEKWDLAFWQNQTPEQRLSALVEICRDIKKVEQGRKRNNKRSKNGS